LQNFLLDEMWSKYNDMPDLHKKQLRETLGDAFGDGFLGATNAARKSLDPELLQYWIRMANGEPVGTLSGGAMSVNFASPEVAQSMQVFYDTRRRYFGDEIWDVQENFFQLGGSARKTYKQQHPELQQYWDWRKDFMMRNPDLAPYIEEDPDKIPKSTKITLVENQPNFTPQEWQTFLGPNLFNLVWDKEAIPESAMQMLDAIATSMGIDSGGDIVDEIRDYTQ